MIHFLWFGASQDIVRRVAMADFASPEKIRISWFSGTGGTKMAAGKLANSFSERGVTVYQQELCAPEQPDGLDNEDLLIILYPVYALNAPGPVYDYIKKHKTVDNTPAAVLSVSGGGEVTPNKACRRRVIRLLEKKGYHVIYERMLVMPSNVFTATPFGAAVCLLRALPGKIEKITGDLLGGVTRRTKPGLLDTILSVLGAFEKTGAKLFGSHIKPGTACNGCGICAALCPTGNIRIEAGKPVYGNKCVTCMKCLYGCPQKALSPRYGKFIMLKEGFSLADAEKAALEDTPYSANEARGVLFGGVRKYLEEKDC